MANDFFQSLIHFTLLCSVSSAAILLLRRPTRRLFGANIAYQIWAIFPLVLLAQLLPNKTIVEKLPVVAQPLVQFMQINAPTIHASEERIPLLITLVWLAGCLLAISWFWRQHLDFIHMLGNVTPFDGVYHAENDDVGPALLGLWSAKIIVPADFSLRYTQDEKDLIIAHEKKHLARGDPYANMLCALAQCLLWFNPLIHLAANRFRADQELACDAAVIAQHPALRRTYAEAILKTQTSMPRTAIGCHLQSHQPLKERIMQLQKSIPNRTTQFIGTASLSVLLVLGTYGAWAASPTSVQETPKSSATGQAARANSSTKKYQVKANVVLDGINTSFRTVSNEAAQADISIDGKSAKWGISYIVRSKKNKKGGDSVILDVTVTKNGEQVSHPKIITSLNMPATFEHKEDTTENNYYFTLEPSVAN